MKKTQLKNIVYSRLNDTSKTFNKVDARAVEKALGAEFTGKVFSEERGGPLSVFQIRQELMHRLHSSGGRPALQDASSRKKIPLSDRQWIRLEKIAANVSAPGFSPSPAQVASIILELSLESTHKESHKKLVGV
jgi:hypothetical protein